MATTLVGLQSWSLSRDDEGFRTYTATFLVRSARQDGPGQVLRTSGLPLPGATWAYGNDTDSWVWAKAAADVKKTSSGDEAAEGSNIDFVYWAVAVPFTNRPVMGGTGGTRRGCHETDIESPLLEPQKVSGSFSRYTQEITTDRFGAPVTNSAFEQLRGAQVEFDFNRPSVRIEQNVAVLQLGFCSACVDCVNDRAMWGLPERSIKLSQFEWEELYYGTCYKYFRRVFTFDVDYATWDRTLLDSGTMALNGYWNTTTGHYALRDVGGERPDRFNPGHFVRFKDLEGNYAPVVLNGFGVPSGVCIDNYVPESFDETVEVYFCILANTGKTLKNRTYWVRMADTAVSTPPNEWDSTTRYTRGNVVARFGFVYIALARSVNYEPGGEVANPNWLLLGTGLTSRGTWQSTSAYVPGDYVVEYSGLGTGTGDDCNTTNTGSITVQKYNAANFYLLGVPAILGV